MTGKLEALRQFGSPIEVVGDLARAAICAPPGSQLLVGDFSGIESRVLAWVAGQHDKVAQWAKFDQTRDPNDDPYVVIGRVLGHPEAGARQYGKIADLAFGYQGGAGAYKNFAPADDAASDAQVEAFKSAWRARHPEVESFWHGIDRAAIAAIHRSPQPISYGRLTLRCEEQGNGKFLFITLPSGRRLAYPYVRFICNRFGHAAVEFMDNAIAAGGWAPCNHGQGAYGGLWTENIVSGVARDLLAAAMLRLEAAGYPAVLHVHDEIVCELPYGEGSLDEFRCLIELRPEWAADMPIAAKVRNGPRFAEVDVPVVHVPGAQTMQSKTRPRKPRKVSAVRARPSPTSPTPSPAETQRDAATEARWLAEIIRRHKAEGRPGPYMLAATSGLEAAAIMEDNDVTGYAHAVEVANALRGIVPNIRIVGFRELKNGGDLTDWIEADRTRGYTELLARIEHAPATDGYEAPKPAPIRQWAGKLAPEQEYTVPDRYPAEQFGLFSGEGAEGKSTIIQHLCAAHSLGRAWLGCMPRQGPAIYLECEDAESVLWRRLAAIAAHYGVPIEAFADAGLQLFSLIDHDTILAATNKRGIVEPTRFYEWLYELAGDLKPVQIGIASVANVFAGNEISRTEVQQFAKLMNRITKVTKGSIVLATHPSLTGISDTSLSHEGLSGTTQWHNAVRARAVIKGVKPKDNKSAAVIDTGLRSITFHKNQYGPPVAGCFVRWQNGLYLPVEGTTQDAAERAAKAEELTIMLLQRFTAQNRNVSINRNPNNYAPTQFAQTPEAGATGLEVEDFKRAIDRLLSAGIIENQSIEKGRGRHRLVLKSAA